MLATTAAFLGPMPIMWSQGTGADMMKRVVAPRIGGLITSYLLELIVYPPLCELWERRSAVPDGSAIPAACPAPAGPPLGLE
jgi:Cu(I)/Ag(I) efflux system membrane protein CusA/SilA